MGIFPSHHFAIRHGGELLDYLLFLYKLSKQFLSDIWLASFIQVIAHCLAIACQNKNVVPVL